MTYRFLAVLVLSLMFDVRTSFAIERGIVRTYVPQFANSNLGANVATILTLRLWTTLRPRPIPNPTNLFFGRGEIKWSPRVLDEQSADAAAIAAKNADSHMALWGGVQEYGSGVVVDANLTIPVITAVAGGAQTWTVRVRGVQLELGLPSPTYQFSPLVISREVVDKYSRPNQVRLCETKEVDCRGTALGNSFIAQRIDGDFALATASNKFTGWAYLPDLSEAQNEVVDFTAALISYLRTDFEQSERLFDRIKGHKVESLVLNDSAILAGISQYRQRKALDGLQAIHAQNPYSRYAVQALVMAGIELIGASSAGESRNSQLKAITELVESYRHLFAPRDRWLANADRCLRLLK